MEEKFYWVTEQTKDFIKRDYLKNGETVEERVWDIAENAEKILKQPGFAKKFYDYMGRGFYSLASPVWSNFGRKGLPISCNNVFIEDSVESILAKQAEVGMQTKHGAGTSAYLGALRPRGSPISGDDGYADGPVHFASLLENVTDIISQGSVRRGSCAVYLPVEHPDIMEFLEIQEHGHPVQDLSTGVTITDAWMQSMLDGDKDKRKVWLRILRKRSERGYPYLFFTDTVNDNAPEVYKEKGLKIWSSNLCTEVMLASTPSQSFVCDLSSMNLVKADEWMLTDAVQVMIAFLDAVMSEYIDKTEGLRFMEPAREFAIQQRALGLGVLGWHSLLQSRGLSFESVEALELNKEIHKFIQEKAIEATKTLARLYGEPPLMEGTGMRNVTLLAIAPTTSSSFILGQVSKGIEPELDNYHTKNLAKGKFSYRNPYLEQLLETKYERNNEETWKSILNKGGSVQHLEWMDEDDRAVYKTFGEISQIAIITQASDRQVFIDQGQSLNLRIHPDTPIKDTSDLYILAWRLGIKSLYYQRSTNKAQELGRNLLECESCSA